MPKLPQGMYRRGPAFYCRLYEGGREIRRSLGEDFEEAKRKLRALRAGTVPLTVSHVTVAEAVPRWLETAISNGRNAKGVRDATTRARKYLVPLVGHLKLSSVRQDDLRGFRTKLELNGCSRSLVHHVLTDARCFFRWCASSGLMEQSAIPARWLPRLPERPPDRLTEEEVAAVSSVPEPYGFVVRLALATGLRWGELSRAEAKDIWNGILVVKEAKSGRVRRVPLSGSILDELKGRAGQLVPFAEAKTVAAYVRKRTGITGFHMHQTRHTFACRYLERGGSLHVLQQLLGHSTVLVTQRYAKLTDEAVLAEHLRLERESPAGPSPAQIPAQQARRGPSGLGSTSYEIE